MGDLEKPAAVGVRGEDWAVQVDAWSEDTEDDLGAVRRPGGNQAPSRGGVGGCTAARRADRDLVQSGAVGVHDVDRAAVAWRGSGGEQDLVANRRPGPALEVTERCVGGR